MAKASTTSTKPLRPLFVLVDPKPSVVSYILLAMTARPPFRPLCKHAQCIILLLYLPILCATTPGHNKFVHLHARIIDNLASYAQQVSKPQAMFCSSIAAPAHSASSHNPAQLGADAI